MCEEVPNYTIRPMKREDIPTILELWKDTGMSEGTYSLDTWFDHDPEGFYVAVADDGTVLGSLAGVLQHEDLAFLGLYVVDARYRGKGIGRKIWKSVIERLGDRNTGVNPVPDQLENYRDRSGFPVQTDWCSIVAPVPELDLSQISHDNPDILVQVLQPDDEDNLDKVKDYDQEVIGFSRGNLLKLLSGQKESVTMFATRTSDSKVCGYGTIKNSIKGNAIIGPLYADDLEVAENILYELVKAFPIAETNGASLWMIDCNPQAMELLQKLGNQHQIRIARLYSQKEIDVKYQNIFCQHDLNFSIF